MTGFLPLFTCVLIFCFSATLYTQPSRIEFNNQQLFLSGANLAWVNYANDIGSGGADSTSFADILLQFHDHGGNAMRWWLHTDGTITPEFNEGDSVVGPGAGTIEDIRKVLDIAWDREIGVKLCLWNYKMLLIGENFPVDVRERNILMLTDTNYTKAYINNSLIPMIDSLKGHPAIIAWEIFNEPEGMSEEFGFAGVYQVPMAAIQRFINLCTGAIHRTDTSALVTSGAWSFQAMTDRDISALTIQKQISAMTDLQIEEIKNFYNIKYGLSLTKEETSLHLQKIAANGNHNYYGDSVLIAAGGDTDGTLDFYSSHYYPHLGAAYSPFIRSAGYWELDKPIVIAEFPMQVNDGTAISDLFMRLYQFGYAGALPWSWTDVAISSHENILAGMQYMWDNYRASVDVSGISGDFPFINIVSPSNNTTFSDTSAVNIVVDAYDNDGQVILVEFFADDTVKIGERDTLPFSITWSDVPPDIYIISAVATDDSGNQRISNRVQITVGEPEMIRLEAETAVRQGANMTVRNDATASGGRFLDIATQSGSVTWTLPAVPEAGSYELRFGIKLFYDSPKEQFILVNGTTVDTLRFEGNTSSWMERPTIVDLQQGENTIRMDLFWGWMYLDYMAVPAQIAVEVIDQWEKPVLFTLSNNYPNPFNPVTNIQYSVASAEHVKLTVYDLLGREVSILVNEEQNPGSYKVSFNASKLSSGIYFYRIQAGSFSQTRRMLLIK